MKLTPCPMCAKLLTPTNGGRFRKHKGKNNDDCDMSGCFVPGLEMPCEFPPSATETTVPSAESPPDDATAPVPSATSTTTSSPPSPEPEGDALIPGIREYVTVLDATSAEQLAAYKAKVEAKLSPYSQPAPEPVEQPTLFSQPASARVPAKPDRPMNQRGVEIAARLKEMFYAYGNRRTSDNRSAQTTLGPSEIGTPCDRRLAMSLMQIPPVNPGGDGWAAFVGTCIHAGLAEMFMWADGGSGRYSVEMPLKFPSAYVPKGTGDLLDRTLLMFSDHKCMGSWSRNKLKTSGPGETYRVQVHIYAWGATMRGEKVDHVAIIAWPREASNLDDLYVWTEPYNPSVARDAMARVDRIVSRVEECMGDLREGGALESPSDDYHLQAKVAVAAAFDVADDCRYCPFYLPKAKHLQHGCNGRR